MINTRLGKSCRKDEVKEENVENSFIPQHLLVHTVSSIRYAVVLYTCIKKFIHRSYATL